MFLKILLGFLILLFPKICMMHLAPREPHEEGEELSSNGGHLLGLEDLGCGMGGGRVCLLGSGSSPVSCTLVAESAAVQERGGEGCFVGRGVQRVVADGLFRGPSWGVFGINCHPQQSAGGGSQG